MMQSTIEVHKKWNIECFSIALVAADNEGGTRLAFRYPDPSVVFQGRILPKEKFLPQLFTPKNLLHNQIVEMVIGRTSRFISYCVSEKDWNTGIAAFNVVLEVAELSTTGASSEDGTHRQQSMDFLKRILVDIAASLNFEENRQKFVSQEVKYMLKVHDQVVLESNRKTGRKHLDYQSQLDVILEHSTLANFLKKLYHSINSKANVQLQLNGFLRISETLAYSRDCLRYPIRPYHSFLLLKDKAETLRCLPPGSSKDLLLLIQHSSPMKTFNEMQSELNISLKRIFVLAAHLMHWNFCIIIKALARDNQYRVKSHSLEKGALFNQKFPQYSFADVLSHFHGSRRLGQILDNMAAQAAQVPQALTGLLSARSVVATSTYVSQARVSIPIGTFLQMLAWLLQHQCIEELHLYVYFNVPFDADFSKNPKAEAGDTVLVAESGLPDHTDTARSDEGSDEQSEGAGHPHLDASEEQPPAEMKKSGMSLEDVRRVIGVSTVAEHEAAYLIERAQEEENRVTYHSFLQLLKFFRGTHHIEEIMWQENLSYSELESVLELYSDVLITAVHPEPSRT